MFYHKFSTDSQTVPTAIQGKGRQGAVLSLMDGRKTRSMSTLARTRKDSGRPESPPLDCENPFKTLESHDDMYKDASICKYLSRSTEFPAMRMREKISERKVQSMFVETSCFNQTLPELRTLPRREKPRHVLSHSSYAIPYRTGQSLDRQSVTSLLSLQSEARDSRSTHRRPSLALCDHNNKDSDIIRLSILESSQNKKQHTVDEIHNSDKAEQTEYNHPEENDNKNSEETEYNEPQKTEYDDPEETVSAGKEKTSVGTTKKKKNVFNFLNIVLRSKFSKVNRQRKVEREHFEKTAKTSFANSDYPLLHTLA